MAIKYARENNLPFLGLCFGMQMATIEYGRNVLELKGANSQEADPNTPHPVIHIMPMQKEYLAKKQYGGTIRLGAWPCKLAPDTIAKTLYKKYGSAKNSPWKEPGKVGETKKKDVIFERHRHRYEFNIKYKQDYERTGLIFSGTSLDGKLMEIIEIPGHKFFVGTQFHPEYISRPLTPHPLFLGFVKAMTKTN